jgi:fibronectin-binding autotransporter adhesin
MQNSASVESCLAPWRAPRGRSRCGARLYLHVATAAAALIALPSLACDSVNRVIPIARGFTANITGVIDNTNLLGCNDSIPLVIETSGVLNNLASLTNEPGFTGGPNGIGGLFVQGLLDNKPAATLTNLADFFVSFQGSAVQGRFINSGIFVNQALFSNWGSVTSTGVIDNRSASFESHSSFVIAGGSFDNSGTATFHVSFANQATVNNTGTVVADDFGFEFHNQGTFNNAKGATLRLNGGLGVLDMKDGTLNNSGALLTKGLIVGDAAIYGALNLLAGGEFEGGLYVATQFHEQVNAGIFRNTTGILLTGSLRNEGVLESTANIDVTPVLGAGLVNNNAFGLRGAKLTNLGLVTNNADMRVGVGGVVLNGGWNGVSTSGHLQNNGTLTIETGGMLDNSGTMENTHMLNNAGEFHSYGSFRNTEGATIVNTLYFTVHVGEVVNQGLIDNAGLIKLDGRLINTGTVNFLKGSHTGGVGTYTQTAGRTNLDGDIDALAGFDILGGELCGTGFIGSSTPVKLGGATVCAGHSPGTLHIGGTLDFTDSTLLMEIAGTAPGQFDVLRVDGLATFHSGVVKLSFLDGYVPSAGDHWRLFEFTFGVEGFSNLTLQTEGLPANAPLKFSLSPSGELAVTATAVPEPATLAQLFFGLAVVCLRSVRRAAGQRLPKHVAS